MTANAIETLREALLWVEAAAKESPPDSQTHIAADELARSLPLALARVDTLLQAAKVVHKSKGVYVPPEAQKAWGDFAAAVRDVETGQ